MIANETTTKCIHRNSNKVVSNYMQPYGLEKCEQPYHIVGYKRLRHCPIL